MSKFERVKAFGLTADEKLRLSLLAGIESDGVVGRSRHSVGADASEGQGLLLDTRRELRKGERIVGGSENSVRAGRKLDRRVHVTHDEPRAPGGAVGDEKLRREKLFQKTDIAGDDENARYPDLLFFTAGKLDLGELHAAASLEHHGEDRRKGREVELNPSALRTNEGR